MRSCTCSTPPPSTSKDGSVDEGLRELQEEARRGVTDGDVIMAFVTLVTVDHREQQFSAMMAMLEDSLDLLVDSGELEIAADAADALRLAADSPSLSERAAWPHRGLAGAGSPSPRTSARWRTR